MFYLLDRQSKSFLFYIPTCIVMNRVVDYVLSLLSLFALGSLGWRIQVFSHRRNARFRVLCKHLVSGIRNDSKFCIGKERHLPFLPFSTNHRLAFTGNEQNLVGKPFHAIDQIDVEIPVGIDSLLKKGIRSPRTISPGPVFFWTSAFTAITCLRMVAALIHVHLIPKVVIRCVIIRAPDVERLEFRFHKVIEHAWTEANSSFLCPPGCKLGREEPGFSKNCMVHK